ncbi:S-adenosyl-L-methionine-dependent methyltransferase [Pelagophyceae sp. CCMP2097]|nr:S-adenosyl-L-methionine-dependent methyltransferase [Pelagophyceae sp. CCMP2097]
MGTNRWLVVVVGACSGLVAQPPRSARVATVASRVSTSAARDDAPEARRRGGRSRAEALPGLHAVGDVVEVRVDRLSNLGDGVGRLEASGLVCFVPFSVPGELISARVVEVSATFARCAVVAVIEKSPDRDTPQCSLYGVCGGCQLQHMTLSSQRLWKRNFVIDALQRIGGLEVEVAEVVGGAGYGYRAKLTPHFFPPKRIGELFPIGFYAASRARGVTDVPRCDIATDAINIRMATLREETQARYRNNPVPPRGSTLLLRQHEGGVETDPRAGVEEHVGGVDFQLEAGEFFQNNPQVLPYLVDYVLAEATNDGKATGLIDAYCAPQGGVRNVSHGTRLGGGGLFALTGASRFGSVAGVDISKHNVAAAKANAKRNGLDNVVFEAGDAEELFKPLASSFDPSCTTVIMDPPRKGASKSFLDQLAAFRPLRIVYVSCDSATQARDAKELVRRGYLAKRAQPFDLFPQTRHVENVITFDLELRV